MRLTDWHLMNAEAVAANLRTDLYRGLSEKDAARRKKKNGENRIWQVKRASATRAAWGAVSDLTTVLLILCAVLSAILENSLTSLFVCAVLIVGVVFRVATYMRAKRIFERMADEGIPNATVIRDGTSRVLRADGIVKGDVIALGEGDVVPCDCRIVSHGEIRVSEKGVTENKSSVIKRDTVIVTDVDGADVPCEYRVNMLFAGSVILAGACRAVATATSDEALVSMKHGGIVIPSGETVPVVKKYERRSFVVNLTMIALILVVSLISIPVRGTGRLAEVFLSMIALAAASMSTYMGALGYITVAVPVRDAANGRDGRAIIKDCAGIEDVASVSRILAADVSVFKNGEAEISSFWRAGKSFNAGEGEPDELLALLSTSVCSVSAEGAISDESDQGGRRKTKLIEAAARSASSRYGRKLGAGFPVIDAAVTKEKGAVVDTVVVYRGGSVDAIVSGPVDAVLAMCDRFVTPDGGEFLTDRVREELIAFSKAGRERGERVCAVASRQSPYTFLKHASLLHSRMRLEGIVSISEGARDVPDLIRENGGGVRISLLSDDPECDLNFLRAAGIIGGSAPVYESDAFLRTDAIPGGDYAVRVPAYDDPEIKRTAVSNVRCAVAGRIVSGEPFVAVVTKEALDSRMMNGSAVGAAVSPSEKRPIPQTLKRRSRITVYPGGGEGSGGAAETCSAIRCARRALKNLSDSLLYVIASQTARVICALVAVFTGQGLSAPAGILTLGVIFDFAAILVTAFRPSSDPSPAVPLNKAAAFSSAAAGAVVGALCSLIPLCGMIRISGESVGTGAATATFTALLFSQLAYLSSFFVRGGGKRELPVRPYLLYAAASVALGAAASFIPAVGSLFGDGAAHPILFAFAAGIAALVFPLGILRRRIIKQNNSDTDSL